jgi:hypothetical protein
MKQWNRVDAFTDGIEKMEEPFSVLILVVEQNMARRESTHFPTRTGEPPSNFMVLET